MRVDLTGQRFGRWTVMSYSSFDGHHSKWCVTCDCGTSRVVFGTGLRGGTSRSCGCLAREVAAAGCKRRSRHGHARRGSHSKEYSAWSHMISRCTRPDNVAYKYYGGRGITICDEWSASFASFLADVGRAPTGIHSVDRIDTDGNYEPGNVRWATPSVQSQNRRCARIIEAFGESLSLTQWSRRFGVDESLIHHRITSGWLAEDAVAKAPRAISTPGTVKAIDFTECRRLRSEGVKVCDLARTYGVSRETLSRALSRGA